MESYEHKQDNVRTMETPSIETWKNQYSDKDYWVHLKTQEISCVCPKTGLPDFGTLQIRYSPDQKCIELKSFKLYLVSFRNIGIFHEHLVNRICDDIVQSCQPRKVELTIEMNNRGGIITTVGTSYSKES